MKRYADDEKMELLEDFNARDIKRPKDKDSDYHLLPNLSLEYHHAGVSTRSPSIQNSAQNSPTQRGRRLTNTTNYPPANSPTLAVPNSTKLPPLQSPVTSNQPYVSPVTISSTTHSQSATKVTKKLEANAERGKLDKELAKLLEVVLPMSTDMYTKCTTLLESLETE